MVMIYSKGLLFIATNYSDKSSVRGVTPVAHQNFHMRKQRERGSQAGGAEAEHQAHGKREADAPQSAVKSKVLHSGTKTRWKCMKQPCERKSGMRHMKKDQQLAAF